MFVRKFFSASGTLGFQIDLSCWYTMISWSGDGILKRDKSSRFEDIDGYWR